MRGKLGLKFARVVGGQIGGLIRPAGWRAGPSFTDTSSGPILYSVEYNSNFSAVTTTAQRSGDLAVEVKFATQGTNGGGIRLVVNGSLASEIVAGTNGSDSTLNRAVEGIATNDVIEVRRVVYDAGTNTYVPDTDGYTTIKYIRMEISVPTIPPTDPA